MNPTDILDQNVFNRLMVNDSQAKTIPVKFVRTFEKYEAGHTYELDAKEADRVFTQAICFNATPYKSNNPATLKVNGEDL